MKLHQKKNTLDGPSKLPEDWRQLIRMAHRHCFLKWKKQITKHYTAFVQFSRVFRQSQSWRSNSWTLRIPHATNPSTSPKYKSVWAGRYRSGSTHWWYGLSLENGSGAVCHGEARFKRLEPNKWMAWFWKYVSSYLTMSPRRESNMH